MSDTCIITQNLIPENINIINSDSEKSDGNLSIASTKTYDKNHRELRNIKKEINIITKENQRLQNDLRIKNDTIFGLINQNFNELKNLKEKHDKMINDISMSHENSINTINHKYTLFRKSLDARMKENINTHHKINGQRISILMNHNQELTSKISDLEKNIELKENKIINLDNELFLINEKYHHSNLKIQELENTLSAIKIQLLDSDSSLEKYINFNSENKKLISELTEIKNKLLYENNNYIQEISNNNNIIKKITNELDHIRLMNHELQNKNIILLNDNITIQTSLDGKILENTGLSSKINELDKKMENFEISKRDMINKITDLTTKNCDLNLELTTLQKNLYQIKLEKESISDDKDFYIKEFENCKNKLKEQETISLTNFTSIQEEYIKNKVITSQEHSNHIKELTDKYEHQINSLKNELNTLTIDKDQRVNALLSHLKTITDNQYIAFNELEKLKSCNEILKNENLDVDKKINNLNIEHKNEINIILETYNKEKETLIETYKETINRLQESNELLQHRLNQSIEALSLSKTTISNLKDSKQELERKIYSKESEDKSNNEKNKDLINENNNLKEKLSRSLEVSNDLSNKEKIYENQIKLLQSKYNQLLSLTKKNINSLNINN